MGRGTSPFPALFPPLHPSRKTSSASLSLFVPSSLPLIFPVFSDLPCSLSPRRYSLPSAAAAALLSHPPSRTPSLSPPWLASPRSSSSSTLSLSFPFFPFLSDSSLRCGPTSSSLSPTAGLSPSSFFSLLLFSSSPASLAPSYAPRCQLCCRLSRLRLHPTRARRVVASLRLRRAAQGTQPASQPRRADTLCSFAELRLEEDACERVETCTAASEQSLPKNRPGPGRRKPIECQEARESKRASTRNGEARRAGAQQESSRAWRTRGESGRDAERDLRGSCAVEENGPREGEAVTRFHARPRPREDASRSEKEDYETLVETLRACDRAYHVHGYSLLPDPVYDQLKARLLQTEEVSLQRKPGRETSEGKNDNERATSGQRERGVSERRNRRVERGGWGHDREGARQCERERVLKSPRAGVTQAQSDQEGDLEKRNKSE
ncbi:UNVERIFIED_CONTAM: hypothetical protein HHA_450940 [Hammondia hammondi]|eukprot:XP_008883444.1 hypothetical protein HHA_450940 [Hammondia hammondi]